MRVPIIRLVERRLYLIYAQRAVLLKRAQKYFGVSRKVHGQLGGIVHKNINQADVGRTAKSRIKNDNFFASFGFFARQPGLNLRR